MEEKLRYITGASPDIWMKDMRSTTCEPLQDRLRVRSQAPLSNTVASDWWLYRAPHVHKLLALNIAILAIDSSVEKEKIKVCVGGI